MLLLAARARFVVDGYAATSTPAIVAEAGVTRGALYHHFVDKRDLFRAVVERESRAVAAEIEAGSRGGGADGSGGASGGASGGGTGVSTGGNAGDAAVARAELVAGGQAYLRAMRAPGRTRLILIEAPAVLGAAEASALDERLAGATLVVGLAAALGDNPAGLPIAELAMLLSAAFDRAALAVEGGADAEVVGRAIDALVAGVVDGHLSGHSSGHAN